jgi:hypothetical protein
VVAGRDDRDRAGGRAGNGDRLEAGVLDDRVPPRDGAGLRAGDRRDDGFGGAVDDERVVAAVAAVDLRDRSRRLDDEGVAVAGGARQVLDVRERDIADRAAAGAVDRPRAVGRGAGDGVVAGAAVEVDGERSGGD